MDTVDIDAARVELHHDREQLTCQIEQLTGDVHAERGTDVADIGAAVTGRDETQALLAAKRTKLATVDAALAAISDGTYGTCTTCSRPIEPERLQVLPASVTCQDCTR